MERPAAVILDLDGTLVDTVETRIRAWLAVFTEFEIQADRAQLAPMIGSDGRRLAREVAASAGRPLADGEDEAIDRRSGEIYQALNRDPRPLPGAREVLERLDAEGLAWAIATSSRREQVAASVDALGLLRAPRVIDGSHVEHAKPAPDLLLRAAEELEVAPDACWCVGDSTWDMTAALAARMVPIAVTAGSAVDADALSAAGARLVLADLHELTDLVSGSQGHCR
jgi:HAD superfamily hydrolase (TIGR01509 family)